MKKIVRRMLLVFVGVLIITSAIPVCAKEKTSEKMKTSKVNGVTYYRVKTEKQLRSIGKGIYKMSYHYILDADITLKKEWVAIGTEKKPFTGTFNGNGYIIRNMKITDKKAKYIGFFGYVEGGSVYNVTLKNVDIASAGGKGKRVGAVVAVCLDGKVYDNKVKNK